MREITFQELKDAGAEYGHKTRYWNPEMKPYIFGERGGIHIIDLSQSVVLANKALAKVNSLVQGHGKNCRILFVGTKTTAKQIVREEAVRAGMPYVDHRWLGGMLTNYKTIKQSVAKIKNLQQMLDSGAGTKKEQLNISRELKKLNENFSGVKDMGGLPEALFVVDVNYESIAVTEAHRLGIPVIGIVDTNSNPTLVDFPIPANDDRKHGIRLIASRIADVILDVKADLKLVDQERENKRKVELAKKAAAAEQEKKEAKEAAPVPAAKPAAAKSAAKPAPKIEPAAPTTSPAASSTPKTE